MPKMKAEQIYILSSWLIKAFYRSIVCVCRDEEKKVVLEQADKLRYFQTDRVKHLHRGLVLSEVLKERQQQVHLKKEIEREREKRDGKFVVLQKLEREEKETEEKRKKERRVVDVSFMQII